MDDSDPPHPPARSASQSTCWGCALSSSACRGTVETTSRVFGNKFCVDCHHLVKVRSELVRALTEEQTYIFTNSKAYGVWNAPSRYGGGNYRVVNNTLNCIGPPIAIFSRSPPETDFPSLPSDWVHTDGFVHFALSRGTLVPSITVRRKRPIPEYSSLTRSPLRLRSNTPTPSPQFSGKADGDDDEWLPDTSSDEQTVDDPPTVHVQLKEEEQDDTDKEDADAYRTKRMMSNRRSAARSREKKREYIAELEHKIKQLHAIVNDLHAENTQLTTMLASSDMPTFSFDLDSLVF